MSYAIAISFSYKRYRRQVMATDLLREISELLSTLMLKIVWWNYTF